MSRVRTDPKKDARYRVELSYNSYCTDVRIEMATEEEEKEEKEEEMSV